MSILKIPPSFAIPYDSGGIHSGFLSPYRNLGQSDLVNMSAWNYLKAQRLNDILLLNCSNLSSRSLAQLILDMRSNFNLLNEPWWPKLIGVSDETHQEIIDILKTKHHLHGVHLLTWETSNKTINEKDLTLICANHGETIYELDSHTNYIVQIAGDQRQCCLGDVTDKNIQSYKNIVKLQSRTKSFNKSKRILTSDLFQILGSLKMKDLFYKKVCKTNDDENYNIKSKVRTGLISH
ncbi:hypothetical protein I4U23_021076 [Adineta vaga]|nr:hypothetical protein I4U23_021076 [Adineta vaga]